MSFTTDRDLLAIEPAVFEDVPFAAQQRLKAEDSVLAGTTLTSDSADFVAAGIDAGCVVLLNRVVHEVLECVDANTLEVSLPRASMMEAAILGGDGSNLELIARTFSPQAEVVHTGLMRLIGVEPEDGACEVSEASVMSIDLLARIEALGTLEVIYSGAASLVGENDMLILKAGEYRRRFREACAEATVLLDVDGDGVVDRRVPLGSTFMTRI